MNGSLLQEKSQQKQGVKKATETPNMGRAHGAGNKIEEEHIWRGTNKKWLQMSHMTQIHKEKNKNKITLMETCTITAFRIS